MPDLSKRRLPDVPEVANEGAERNYSDKEYENAKDLFGRMKTAESMGMPGLMPSDEEFKSVNQDAFAAVSKEAQEEQRRERLKQAEALSSGVKDSHESPLAEYGIY